MFGKKKPVVIKDKMEYAPKFCHTDGKLLQLVENKGFDSYTGKEVVVQTFVECPDIQVDNHKTWKHSRYQWMEGNGRNSIWLPLDNF